MENHYADLFRVIFTLNYLVLFLSFTEVKSAPVTQSIIDVMRNDTKICPTPKFIFSDSKYTKPCASIAYPTTPRDYNPETINDFLCLGVYDTAYKICQYVNSSRLQIPPNNTAAFNSYVEKYVPDESKAQEEFCKDLQGFKSLYVKIDSLWERLVKSLNTPHMCMKICFDFQDQFQPLCAVIAWIKSIDDTMKSPKKVEPDFTAYNKLHINQSKDEEASGIKTTTGSRKSGAKEFKEQDRKQITDSNDNGNVKEGNSNVPANAPLDVTSDREKTKSDIEKANDIQKKINTSETQNHKLVPSILKKNKESGIDTELGINAEVTKPVKPVKDIPPNGDSQAPSMNNPISNKKVVNEENTQKSNREQNIDDLKPSTLSENTQDHYEAANPEENMENDIDDVDDTIQHPDTGNQNENVQEAFEQKKNNARLTEYSNIRTEDDSHFFTYFTVITLACLAGYIGYHNKQKIFAIVLEGRRSRSNRNRRRPSTASYRKLDCTLEEAVTSQCNANVTHVIY